MEGQVEERQVVAGQRTLSVFTSLLRTRGVRRHSPISMFLPTLRERRERGVVGMADLAAARREGMASHREVREGWRQEGGGDTQLIMGVSRSGDTEEHAVENIVEHLR